MTEDESHDRDAKGGSRVSEAGGLFRSMLIAALVLVAIGLAALIFGIWFAGEPAPLPFDYDGFD